MYGNPNIKPLDLSFDWLFDRITQEEVYFKYFGFCEIGIKYCNPLRRGDKKPDCKFYWHNGVLFFNDIAYKKAYTCVTVVMEIEKLSYNQSLHKIYNIFLAKSSSNKSIQKIIRNKEPKQYKDIKCKIQSFTNTDIKYLKSFGITYKNCKDFKVYSIKQYWLDGEIRYNYNEFNPCIGYYYNKKWKLYFYKATEYRFLTNIPHTELQGYDELDWIGNICIITKSMKDVIVWKNLGFSAVAPHSEGLGEWKIKIPLLQKRFKRIILNFDNDKAGRAAIEEVLKEFNLEIFLVPEEKDISGFYRKFGLEKTKQLTKQLINK